MRLKSMLQNSTGRPATPMAHARRPGSRESFFNGAGEINASNKRDVAEAIAQLLELVQSGVIVANANDEKSNVDIAASREYVIAAFNDKQGPAFAEIGAEMATQLKETAERDGFMRQLLVKAEVAQGAPPRHRIIKRDVTAVIATGMAQLNAQYLQSNHIYPPEFGNSANIMMSTVDLAQTPGDILDEKFNEGLEAMMVAEDRMVRGMFDASVGVEHQLQYISGGLTPVIFSAMTSKLTAWNIPAGPVLFAADLWDDMRAGSAFAAYYDPVTKLEMIQSGRIMRFLGSEFITDGFRHPQQKVLAAGEMYVLGTPEYLGAYTERGPIESTDINGAYKGVAGRGWFFNSTLSCAVHNARAVVKAQRA